MSLLRDAFRSFRRSPALSAAAVCCIALGSVATTGIAALVDATLLRPVPFPDGDRLARVWVAETDGDTRLDLSIPEARDIQSTTSFDALYVTARVRVVVPLRDTTERLRGEGVTQGYFEALGVRAPIGRLLEAGDHAPGAPPAIVLSHGTWQRGFGGDPGVIGSTLRTERAAYTIVGVAPRYFIGSVESDVIDFWIPLTHYEPASMIRDRDVRQSWIIGRLKPGATVASAQAELDAVTSQWKATYADLYTRRRLRVEPLGENWRSDYRSGVATLAAAAVVLLAIAAINVGCLLFARVLDRRREIAVRAALGADARRLALTLFVEALAIVVAGGALGAISGSWLLSGFLALSPVALPSYLDLRPQAWTFLGSLAALAVAGVLAGMVPVFAGRRVAPGEALKEGGRGSVGGSAERRIGSVLIAAEVALTLTLLVSGGLLLRAYERLTTLDLGYRRSGIARLAVTFSRADAGSPESRQDLFRRLQQEIASHPGVANAGLVSPTLPPWDAARGRIRYQGLDASQFPEGVAVGVHQIDDGLLPALGVPIVEGRNLSASDGPAAPAVAVVSRTLADRCGGPSRAIGQYITFADPMAAGVEGSFRIVGVAGDVAYDGVGEQDTRRYISYANGADPRSARLDVYLPLARFPVTLVSIAAFTSGDARLLVEPLRRRIAGIAPTSAVHWTGTMEDDVSLEYARSRFYALLVASFSAGALAVTSLGLFALLSHAAARRAPEMGLRMALGATPRQAALLLLGDGAGSLIAGALLGVIGAIWAASAMRSLLYEVQWFDGWAFAGALAVLVAVTVLAGLVPARRVASVDPLRVLRM